MTTPPRPARWAERAALALLAAGASLYAAAFAQMRRLESGTPAAAPEAKVIFGGLLAHARYARWADAGVALVAAGLATAVAATAWTALARRRATRAATRPTGTAA